MRDRGSAGGFEFGSDSQARVTWWHSVQMLLYVLAIAIVAWPVAVWLLRRLDVPPAWPWALVGASVPWLVRVLVYRISKWWALPGPGIVVLTHLVWPVSWWVALIGAVATAVALFGAFGMRFVLEQREFPWAVLEARSPHPAAPESKPRIIPVHHFPRYGAGSEQDQAETRAAIAAATGRPQLPEPEADRQARLEEEANWKDLEHFVKALDHGESADIRSWVTDPPRIMPSGRPMTQGMWRKFTKAVEAVGGAVRPYRTAPLELCMRPPSVMYLLREAARRQ